MEDITAAAFEGKYGLKLERQHMRARAVKIFKDCGPALAWKIDILFEQALKHNKVSRVVNAFEEAWEEHLVHIANPIDRGVAIMRFIDHISATIFDDVIERMLGTRPQFV